MLAVYDPDDVTDREHEPERDWPDDCLLAVAGRQFLRVPLTARLELVGGAMPTEMVNPHRDALTRLGFFDRDNLLPVRATLAIEGMVDGWSYLPRAALVKAATSCALRRIDLDIANEHLGRGAARAASMPAPRLSGVITCSALTKRDRTILPAANVPSLDLSDRRERPLAERLSLVAWGVLLADALPWPVEHTRKLMKAGALFMAGEWWANDWRFEQVGRGRTLACASQNAKADLDVIRAWAAQDPESRGPVVACRLEEFVLGGEVVAGLDAEGRALAATAMETRGAAGGQIRAALVHRHQELHEQFQRLGANDHRRPRIIDEHERITRLIAMDRGLL